MARPAIRTQIYLTPLQRRELDRIASQRGVSMASVIRDAIDDYLVDDGIDASTALEVTFGAAPELEVPNRDEWARG
jgi:hypothetical protein